MEIPKDLERETRQLSKDELSEVFRQALRERLSEELMFKLADELLKNSKMTDELALKLGNELKERVAKRHGL